MESIIKLLMTQAEAAPGGQPPAGPMGGCAGMGGMVIPLLLMFVIFYFLLFRPQQKQQKQHKAMLSGLKKGDKIVTSSGIFGTLVNLNDTIATLEVAKNVHIRVLRAQIAGLQPGALEKASEELALPTNSDSK